MPGIEVGRSATYAAGRSLTLLDAGLVAARLAALAPTPAESEVHARVLASPLELLALVSSVSSATVDSPLLDPPTLIDPPLLPVDDVSGRPRRMPIRPGPGVGRFPRHRPPAAPRDLVARRISHVRAAQVMRDIDARARCGPASVSPRRPAAARAVRT